MGGKPARGLFVTGTDTGIGKTYVASLVARALTAAGHRVGAYKPAASGCRSERTQIIADDAVALWEAIGKVMEPSDVCPQRFAAPLAPHLAARAENRELDTELLRTGIHRWYDRCDLVVVEGAGGLMSPLGDDEYVADLAHDLGYPLIVVAPNVLGVINQTLQTLIAATHFRDGIPVAGVVLNDLYQETRDPSTRSNRAELQRRCGVPVICGIGWNSESFDQHVDWFALADGPSDGSWKT
jgi:dethiobiotin synthetase